MARAARGAKGVGQGLSRQELDACPSLLHGVDSAVCGALGIANLRHKSAVRNLVLPPSLDLASVVHAAVTRNWAWGDASDNVNRSRQNWRWTLQPQISPRNRSPEVCLERAIATACCGANLDCWANQIPVASGLIAGASDGRRAVDLAQRVGNGTYELIELKIASDTPHYAAVELLGYASVFLLACNNPPESKSELLSANRLDLRVLAPAAYYSPFDLGGFEAMVDRGTRAIGQQSGIELSFRFDVLPPAVLNKPLPTGRELLETMASRKSLHD